MNNDLLDPGEDNDDEWRVLAVTTHIRHHYLCEHGDFGSWVLHDGGTCVSLLVCQLP